MKPLICISAFYGLLSLLVLAAIALVKGFSSMQLPVEIMRNPRTSFSDEALRVSLESAALRRAREPLMLVLGASVAQEACRPEVLQPGLPGLQVNNFAIGAANFTEISQALAHCLKSAPAELVERSVLFLPVGYALAVPDAFRWRHKDFVSPDIVAAGVFISDIQREALRSPPVLDTEHPFFQWLPGSVSSLLKQRLAAHYHLAPSLPPHPGDKILRWKLWRFQTPEMAREKTIKEAASITAPPIVEMTAHRQMEWLTEYMGGEKAGLDEAQFSRLEGLLHRAVAAGMRIVVADMPLPSWHRAESPFPESFSQRLKALLLPLTESGRVFHLDLREKLADDLFRDSVHPTEAGRAAWAVMLNQELAKCLGLAPPAP